MNFLDFQRNAAYVAFTKVYKPKFTYFKRTIESFANYVGPIKQAFIIYYFLHFLAKWNHFLMNCAIL